MPRAEGERISDAFLAMRAILPDGFTPESVAQCPFCSSSKNLYCVGQTESGEHSIIHEPPTCTQFESCDDAADFLHMVTAVHVESVSKMKAALSVIPSPIDIIDSETWG